MLTTHPPSKCRGHERVELYLYSPSGPHWPVIGRAFTFTFTHWTVRGSNPAGKEFFSHPSRTAFVAQPSLLYSGCRVFPSRTSWPVLGWLYFFVIAHVKSVQLTTDSLLNGPYVNSLCWHGPRLDNMYFPCRKLGCLQNVPLLILGGAWHPSFWGTGVMLHDSSRGVTSHYKKRPLCLLVTSSVKILQCGFWNRRNLAAYIHFTTHFLTWITCVLLGAIMLEHRFCLTGNRSDVTHRQRLFFPRKFFRRAAFPVRTEALFSELKQDAAWISPPTSVQYPKLRTYGFTP